MGSAYSVALVGFSEAESATFDSFFRMAARRPPAYRVQDEVLDAQILVVNADNAQALHLVRYAELPGKVLLVGHHDGGTGWPLQRKPVRLVSVLAALDALTGVRRGAAAPREQAPVAAQGFAATEPFHASLLQGLDVSMQRGGQVTAATAPMVPAVRTSRRRSADSEFPPTRPLRRAAAEERVTTPPAAPPAPPPAPAPVAAPAPRSAAPRGERPGVVRLTDFGGLEDLPAPLSVRPKARSTRSRAPAVPEVQRGDALLVAESLVEGRILFKRFARYGLSVDWSREGSQALAMLKAHPYRLVIVDRMSRDPDGFQVCRQAKQVRLPNGQAPVVVMFAPSAGSMERIKAGLAGADAYYSRSVTEAELYRTLAAHRLINLHAFEPTNVSF